MILWWQNVRLLLLLSYSGVPILFFWESFRLRYQFRLLTCSLFSPVCDLVSVCTRYTTTWHSTLYNCCCLQNPTKRTFVQWTLHVCVYSICFFSLLFCNGFICLYWFAGNNSTKKEYDHRVLREEYCLDNVRAIVMIALNSNKMLCNGVHAPGPCSCPCACLCIEVPCWVSMSLHQRKQK